MAIIRPAHPESLRFLLFLSFTLLRAQERPTKRDAR